MSIGYPYSQTVHRRGQCNHHADRRRSHDRDGTIHRASARLYQAQRSRWTHSNDRRLSRVHRCSLLCSYLCIPSRKQRDSLANSLMIMTTIDNNNSLFQTPSIYFSWFELMILCLLQEKVSIHFNCNHLCFFICNYKKEYS